MATLPTVLVSYNDGVAIKAAVASAPAVQALRLTLAPTGRSNTFQFIFGNLPPISHTINGTAAPAP